jgi:hypothetical protein
MNRPLKRPDTPYNVQTIIDMAMQHFVEDSRPRCVITQSDSTSPCAYIGTGCFVGFMLTAEDAASLPNSSLINLSGSKYIDILSIYFDLQDPLVRFVLAAGQCHHDSWGSVSGEFRNYMYQWLNSVQRGFTAYETDFKNS